MHSITQYFFPLSFLFILFALWKAKTYIGRGPLTGLLFFSGALFPALGFINFYPMRFSFVADHFQYLASIGLITLITYGINQWFAQRWPVKVLVFLILVCYGVLTWSQSSVYKNTETLWENVIMQNPSAWMAHNNLGVIMKQKGKLGKAKFHFKQAIRLNPDYDEPYNNLGIILHIENKLDEAKKVFKFLLKNNPYHIEGINNLGLVYLAGGELKKAKDCFSKAIKLNPRYFNARNNLGLLFALNKNLDEAIYQNQIALILNPKASETRYNLNLILAAKGHGKKSEKLVPKGMIVKPSYNKTKKDLARAIPAE